MSDNHHAGKQISMHQQHHPSACNNRGLVNQHEEDTIEASLEEENGDHEVRRIKDSPRTITGAEDPYFTEGIKNPGWLSTAALFLTTFSIFGITFCWGVFQPHYLNHVYPGQTDVFRIAFIGTSAQAITTLLGLPLTWVIRWIGYKGTMMIGMVLLPLGLILASFATQLWQTALTHGVLVGIGAAFCFSSSFMLPSQWFIRRRATVNGIGNAGACVGALCLSPLAQHLIETVGYRNALRVLGCIVFALLSLAALISRARYPPSHSSTTSTTPTTLMEKKRCRVSLFRSSPFVSAPFAFALVFSLLTPFGYVAPFYLMPTYVMQVVGSSASMGAAFVSVGMATGIVSRLGFGFIGDRIGPINALFLATLISAILIMALWPFSHSLPVCGIFSAAIGLSAGTYFGLIPSVLARIAGMERLYVSGAVAWMFISIGSLLGTPCVGKMQKDLGWPYAIQFAGAVELVAALCMLAIRLLLDRRFWSKI